MPGPIGAGIRRAVAQPRRPLPQPSTLTHTARHLPLSCPRPCWLPPVPAAGSRQPAAGTAPAKHSSHAHKQKHTSADSACPAHARPLPPQPKPLPPPRPPRTHPAPSSRKTLCARACARVRQSCRAWRHTLSEAQRERACPPAGTRTRHQTASNTHPSPAQPTVNQSCRALLALPSPMPSFCLALPNSLPLVHISTHSTRRPHAPPLHCRSSPDTHRTPCSRTQRCGGQKNAPTPPLAHKIVRRDTQL